MEHQYTRPEAQHPPAWFSGLQCDQLFGLPVNEESMTDCVADLMYLPHDIHYNKSQHSKVASKWMKTHYDHLASSMVL
jgi:hypothetical protein